jgi:hypothetical protein
MLINAHRHQAAFHSKIFQAVLSLCLIVVLYATHVLLPPGYMPERAASGLLKIRICAAAGPQSILIDAQDGKQQQPTPAKKTDHQSKLCSFAKLITPLLLQDTTVKTQLFYHPADTTWSKDSKILLSLADSSNSARGPPV